MRHKSTMVATMLCIDVDDPWPKLRGKVWIPTSPTRWPATIALMASSAPMNGLFDSRRISSIRDRRTIRSPVDTSRKRVRNMKRRTVLYTHDTKVRVLE